MQVYFQNQACMSLIATEYTSTQLALFSLEVNLFDLFALNQIFYKQKKDTLNQHFSLFPGIITDI